LSEMNLVMLVFAMYGSPGQQHMSLKFSCPKLKM
jgi:hypothetical protein